jgi:hypothetical protein
MLKKIALAGLFAITFAAGVGVAHAKTRHAPVGTGGQLLCPKGGIC